MQGTGGMEGPDPAEIVMGRVGFGSGSVLAFRTLTCDTDTSIGRHRGERDCRCTGETRLSAFGRSKRSNDFVDPSTTAPAWKADALNIRRSS